MNGPHTLSRTWRPGRCWLVGAILGGLLAVALASRDTWAEPKPRVSQDRIVVQTVAAMMRQHMSRHPLNDEISQRWLAMFLKMLDPMKVYFTQADADEFGRMSTQLDDKALKGDVSFAYEVYNRFLLRIEERVSLVRQLLELRHDFTVEEDLPTDPKKALYAKSDAEVRELWRKRIKYDLLVLKSDKIEGPKAIEKLNRRYSGFLKRMKQTDNDELLEMYVTAMTSSYDPHTSYMSPGTLENFEIQMRLNLQGIGAALQYNDGYTIVNKVIPGGAAARDGRLKKDDKLIAVGEGHEGPLLNVEDLRLNDIVKKIRGKPGTVVRLQVIPDGQADPKVYDITRAEIELKDSEARSEIIEEGKKPDGSPYRVGVINLPSFYMDMEAAREGAEDFKSTTRDVRKLLAEFKQKQVDAVVIDLRMNGGGALNEAINLTGLFIEQGPVVQVKDADGRVQGYDDPDPEEMWSGPLVVLISKFSASASEIFAGAIQDYHRGLILGDTTTHGKGTVQTLQDIGQKFFRVANTPSLGALKVTTQQFYRPSGRSTQNKGVAADVVLPSLSSHLDVGEATLDYALKYDEIDTAPHKDLALVRDDLVGQLRQASQQRVAQSKDFAKEQRKISRYLEQKQLGRVSLVEQKFLADRAELNAEKEEEKELEELNDPNRPVVDRNYYFNEALAVTLDYVRLMNKPRTDSIGVR